MVVLGLDAFVILGNLSCKKYCHIIVNITYMDMACRSRKMYSLVGLVVGCMENDRGLELQGPMNKKLHTWACYSFVEMHGKR